MATAGRPRALAGRHITLPGALSVLCAVVAVVALVDLGIRSAIDLNLRWDAFMYHIPFAAARVGLPISYDLSDTMRPFLDGFPPLPDIVQGLLWRVTGSVNATGVADFLAFVLFLAYGHRVLRAPFWLVALISLTAPLVVIHLAVSYVDLFGNAFLAMGICSCLYVYLFPERPSRAAAIGGLAALATAAWCKYFLVPIAGVTFLLFLVVLFRSTAADRLTRRQAAALVLVFMTIAAVPYAKNLAAYGNPFWPTRVPVVGSLFPYLRDDTTATAANQRPPSLVGAPQPQVFVESLLEIGVPTAYPNRPRWIIDQGNANEGFRMGGFWGLGVVAYLGVALGMLVVCRRRRGLVAGAAGVGILCLVAVIPQSNELRYFLFIPLTWAATIGMLFPLFRQQYPRAGIGLLVVVLALFGYMVAENQVHYRVEKVDFRDAAVAWGAASWWPQLQRGTTYCVVDMVPLGVMMTGPTLTEYTIVDRSRRSLCPAGSTVVTANGIEGAAVSDEPRLAADALAAGLKAHQAGDLAEAARQYRLCLTHDPANKACVFDLGVIAQALGDSAGAEADYRRALDIDRDYAPALYNLAILRTAAGDVASAIDLYRRVLALDATNAAAHFNLGVLLRSTGDFAAGDGEVGIAVSLDPGLRARAPAPGPPASPSARP